jgi:predicted nuclease of predicted toxin-antitoxin system
MKFLMMLNFHDVSLTSYARQDLKQLHTLDLPEGNRTTDQALITFSLTQHCVAVTKDSDFVETFLLRHEPWKLLLVSTGNIDNDELLRLFHLNIDQLTESFKTFDFIELNRTSKICHL